MNTRLICIGLLLVCGSGWTVAQDGIRFDRTVSQTSVWPGGRIQMEIILDVPRGFKVALEDLDAANLTFEPFVLLERQVESEETETGTRHRFEYLLVNFEIGDKAVEIPPVMVRYEEAVTVDASAPSTTELLIPAYPIAIRTTLNRPVRESWIRESLTTGAPYRAYWAVALAGLVGLLVSGIPLGTWTWRQLPDWQARRRQLSRKIFLKKLSASVDEVTKLDTKDDAEIKARYAALEGLVREYIQYFGGLRSGGLTAHELSAKLSDSNIGPEKRETLTGIVEHGQQCRYSPSNGEDWSAHFRADVNRLRTLCS